MRLKTFNAPDIQDAMNLIRESMGEDAVIISTTANPQGPGIRVTVAADSGTSSDRTSGSSFEKNLPQFTPLFTPNTTRAATRPDTTGRDIAKILAYHSIPDYLSNKLIETARFVLENDNTSTRSTQDILASVLESTFQFEPLPIHEDRFRLMLVGPPGIGKTMCIAKIAAQIAMEKKKVMVVTTDNKRAGGVEQLSAFTNILGLELHIAGNRNELRKLLLESPHEQRILIDTAGTNPYDTTELKELSQYVGLEGVESVLATASGSDCREMEDIARAFSMLGLKKLLITRADTARRFGSVLTAATAGNLAYCNVSSTSKVIGEFHPMSPEYLATLLFRHRLDSTHDA
jgi:flagellar biosynthesis protein FlhF